MNDGGTRRGEAIAGSWVKAGVSRGELLLREYIKLKYHWVDIQYNVRPDWLKWKTGNNLELDIYIPELETAFEFNGEHHLKDNKQKERDNFKKERCGEKGVKLYIFSLQTLHHYVQQRGHTNDKYKGWFNKLDALLNNYRQRFNHDKTVAVTILPTVYTYKGPYQKFRSGGVKFWGQNDKLTRKGKKGHKHRVGKNKK